MATTREAASITKKQLQQRELLWPGVEPYLWNRKPNKGFATIPKTMPVVLQIMDDLSNGKPMSSTYLGLWCGTWDNSMVNISKPQEMRLKFALATHLRKGLASHLISPSLQRRQSHIGDRRHALPEGNRRVG
jgi:hypothetical protein